MKAIIPNFNEESKRALYLELYDYIQCSILDGSIQAGEKLPSLRSLSKSLGLSLTTIELAYNQLLVEGYVNSKPQSGYYVNKISAGMGTIAPIMGSGNGADFFSLDHLSYKESPSGENLSPCLGTPVKPYHDTSCFDFIKWKKCMNKVLTEYPHLLLHESDPQGELALRHEISKYIYLSRGVICTPQQIVIGAGTQQITSQLCTLLTKMAIKHVAVEAPGYLPILNIFGDREFAITPVSVSKEGIQISKLPSNIRSAVYVNPSNQFPTGYIMPIAKRYELLAWAADNDSIIIEDDYDSELRYFGKPVPSLQGLDRTERVVYLGSFSSTLFPSIKISYMVLPPTMALLFQSLSNGYAQTCSKTEQLTLALYMEKGMYQTNIKKLRTLYSQKLQAVLAAINQFGLDFIKPLNSSSGIHMLINIKSKKTSETLCKEAEKLGIITLPITIYTDELSESYTTLIFYYNQIPLKNINQAVEALIKQWMT